MTKGLLVFPLLKNSLSFCLKHLFCYYFCRIIGCHVFYFSTLKISFHCILPRIISVEKFAASLDYCSAKAMCLFLWLFLNIFTLHFAFNNSFIVRVHVIFFVFFLLRVHSASWICDLIHFFTTEKFSAISFSNIISAPFSFQPCWDWNYIYVTPFLCVSDGSYTPHRFPSFCLSVP